MPHLRLEVAEEWLREDFRLATGFDAKKLLDRLVRTIADLRMENPAIEARRKALRAANPDAVPTEAEARMDAAGNAIEPEMVPMINLSNLKHAIVPLYYAHVAGDPAKRFLHVTFSCGNETAGRTAAVRSRAAHTLGEEVDKFTSALPALTGLASVTAHVLDIDRERGYSTTAERRKKREAGR